MLITRFILETLTPMHCGGGNDPLQDQAVNRDAFGLWRIPGSSVAGILRGFVQNNSLEIENTLFGSIDINQNGASKIWCSDAFVLDYDKEYAFEKSLQGKEIQLPLGPFIRDHVNLDLVTNTTIESGKFDEEIVPPGVQFALELKLDGWNEDCTEEEKAAFLELCSQIKFGHIRLGGKHVSGYGKVRALYAQCKEFDLKDEQSLTQWLNLKQNTTFDNQGKNVEIPDDKIIISSDNLSARISMPLVSNGPILVGGSNTTDSTVDMVCLQTPIYDYERKQEKNTYTIPGSSIRGALRHRVFNVATALSLNGDKIVDGIFGKINVENPTCGKVVIDDIYLKNVEKGTKVQHVAIDRFTGGAISGALFDEAPIRENDLCFELNIEVDDLEATEAKILTHALLDLAMGNLPIGGGTNRGNGVLKLKDLDKGLATALQGISCTAVWGEDKLESNDLDTAQYFLERLEEGE